MHTQPSHKEYVVDVTYDTSTMTQLTLHHSAAVKDTDETVVNMIVKHDFSDPKDKKWLVRWVTEPPSESWETYETFKMLMHFITTVPRTNSTFSPKLTPQFSASVPNMSRRTASGQFTFPPVEPTVPVTTQPTATLNYSVRRTRGRPTKGPLPEDA